MSSYDFYTWTNKGRHMLFVKRGGKKIGGVNLADRKIATEPGISETDVVDGLKFLPEYIMPGSNIDLIVSEIEASLDAPSFQSIEPGWTDLSKNHPGQSISQINGKSYKSGVAGEQRTAGVLSALGTDSFVLHSVPISQSKDIDHIVITPNGVFTINTKQTTYSVSVSSNGAVFVSSRRLDWISDAQRDAHIASQRLSECTGMDIQATPLICVWSELEVPVDHPIVVPGEDLLNRIKSKNISARYSDSAMLDLIHFSRRSTTWV